MESISENLDNSGLPIGLRASTLTNEAIACAMAKLNALYQEYLNMAKNKSQKEMPEVNLEAPARNKTPAEMDAAMSPEDSAAIERLAQADGEEWCEESALRIADAMKNGDTAMAPEKKARKKPDRSNPPYYEIYSEKDGGKEVKLEGRTETAGKALKFIYLHAARVAVDARKLYVVRCKRLTDAELLD